jgi:type II secretory pathway pseudopilin PulG
MISSEAGGWWLVAGGWWLVEAELRGDMIFKSSKGRQRGAILMLLLIMIVILGLAAGMAGQTWSSTMQRAREAELLWRGQQYEQAIASYYAVKHGPQQMLPAKLDDLLRDPRFPNVVRHLRKIYKDPMTGDEMELITDPAERIIGVRSSSDLQPFQQDGFPKELDKLRGKSSYREWEFVFVPAKRTSQPQSSKNPFRVPVPSSPWTQRQIIDNPFGVPAPKNLTQ